MRKKFLVRGALLVAAIAAVTLVTGQACTKMTALPGRKPAVAESLTPGGSTSTTESENNGNGGGYGGMVAVAVGPYGQGLKLPPASTDGYPAFQIVGRQNVCILDVLFGMFAPLVKHRVFRGTNGYFAQGGFCSGSVPVDPNTLNVTDYNQDTLVHESKVHLYYGKNPAEAGEVRRAAIHCQAADGLPNQTQTGVDVTVYTVGGRYQAIVHRGVKESMGYIKYQIGPANVEKYKTSTGYNFRSNDFDLYFKYTSPGRGQAHIEVELEHDDEIERDATCWSDDAEL